MRSIVVGLPFEISSWAVVSDKEERVRNGIPTLNTEAHGPTAYSSCVPSRYNVAPLRPASTSLHE